MLRTARLSGDLLDPAKRPEALELGRASGTSGRVGAAGLGGVRALHGNRDIHTSDAAEPARASTTPAPTNQVVTS